MPFSVSCQHDLATNLHRLLLSQTRRAMRQLERFESSPRKSVHEARISCKRARTLLRLLRHGLGQRNFRNYNRMFRDMGLALSSRRDADVTLKVIRDMLANDPASLGPVDETTHILEQHRKNVSQVLVELGEATSAFGKLRFKEKGFLLVREPAIKLCQRERQAKYMAAASTADEDFHEWRKAAKHLYHFSCIMRSVKPDKLNPVNKELYRLTRLLGRVQDLSVVKQGLQNNQLPIENGQHLLPELQRRQLALKQQAIDLGDAIHGENPVRFIRRIEKYWKRYRKHRN